MYVGRFSDDTIKIQKHSIELVFGKDTRRLPIVRES